MTLHEHNCIWQELMNKAYAVWQAHNKKAEDKWSFNDMLHKACSTEAERAACVLGKLNQQIENGGVIQWVDNGYAVGSGCFLEMYLTATGPVGVKIYEMLAPFVEFMESCDVSHMLGDDAKEDEASITSDELSERFYELQDDWHVEVYAYLKSLIVKSREVVHDAVDAMTGKRVRFVVQLDNHGLTVELENGHVITVDASGGAVSVYYSIDADSVGERLCLVNLT